MKYINIIWKVSVIILLVVLSLIPLDFMRKYAQSMIDVQNSLANLVSQSTNYLTNLIDSVQGNSSNAEIINIRQNYLLAQNSIVYVPITLGLAFLLLLVIDITKAVNLSVINYFIVGLGLLLFYSIELVTARYTEFELSYFIPATVCCLLLMIYLSGATRSLISGVMYGVGLLIIYTVAFWLLSYIENVLLYGVGSLVIAFIVIIVMTRYISSNRRKNVT